MKHLTVLLFVMLLWCCTDTAVAQLKFGAGLRTGLNFGTMSFDPDPTQQNPQISKGGRTTFLIGAIGEIEFARMFAAQVGLIFVSKGGKLTAGPAELTLKWSELDVPMLFKVKFLEGRIRPYAFAGPNLGFVLSAGSTFENPPNPPQDLDYKAGDPTILSAGSIDFALEFGGGAEFMAMRNLGIFLDLRYSLGLTNLVSPPARQVPQTSQSWKASGFQMQVGSLYYF